MEGHLASWLLLGHLDPRDAGVRRTALAPPGHRLDGVGRTLEHGLDRAVGAVSHPAVDSPTDRLAPAAVAEEDALHSSSHDHPPPDHHAARVRMSTMVAWTPWPST